MRIQEAITVLRSIDQNIDNILSDFSVPHKINLVEFMERNYMFNMPLEKFGYLTGRSLNTFKRDFKEAYNTTPQKIDHPKTARTGIFPIGKKEQETY